MLVLKLGSIKVREVFENECVVGFLKVVMKNGLKLREMEGKRVEWGCDLNVFIDFIEFSFFYKYIL